MSVGINRVILVGHLGRDPELRRTADGAAVCEMSLATSERWRDRDNQPQERTEWHRVVAWHRVAENCAEYLRKGSPCSVEGKLQTFSWVDKDGVKRYTTKVVANRVVFLSGHGGRRSERREDDPPESPPPNYGRDREGDDEIPF